MDTITHVITGAVIAGPAKEKLGWVGAAALAGALGPDADLWMRFLGDEIWFRYHRVVTNSLVGVALLPLLITLLIWLATGRRHNFRFLWLCVFLGYATHVFMDYTNAYGSPLFWPFSGKWYALDWVFIIDPWVSGLVLLSTVLMLFKVRPMPVAVACFSLLACYYGMRAYMHGRAVDVARAEFPAAVKVGAFPAPMLPYKWKLMAETEGSITGGWYSLLDGAWLDKETHAKPPDNGAVDIAKSAPNAERFLEFARFPLTSYERTEGGWVVKFRDLRFSYRPDDRERFVARVKVLDDGSIAEDGFRF